MTQYQPGQRVILPNGNVGTIVRELEIGEYKILTKNKDGVLFHTYLYPEELQPYKEEQDAG